MNPVAKLLVLCGALLIVVGLLWQIGGRHLPLGRLPGDIAIERDGFRFYFPIVTGLLISLVLTVVLAVIRFFGR